MPRQYIMQEFKISVSYVDNEINRDLFEREAKSYGNPLIPATVIELSDIEVSN